MPPFQPRLLYGLILALAIGLLLQLAFRSHDPTASLARDAVLEPGEPLPDAILHSVGGQTPRDRVPERLSELWEVQTCSLVLFFQSTCPGCESAAPAYSDLVDLTVNGAAVPIVWIGEQNDTGAPEFLERHRLAHAALIGREDWKRLRINAVPQFYLVDSQGILRVRGWGDREYAEQAISEEVERGCQ